MHYFLLGILLLKYPCNVTGWGNSELKSEQKNFPYMGFSEEISTALEISFLIIFWQNWLKSFIFEELDSPILGSFFGFWENFFKNWVLSNYSAHHAMASWPKVERTNEAILRKCLKVNLIRFFGWICGNLDRSIIKICMSINLYIHRIILEILHPIRQVKHLKNSQKRGAFSQFLRKPQGLIQYVFVLPNFDFNKQCCFLTYSAFLHLRFQISKLWYVKLTQFHKDRLGALWAEGFSAD